MIQQIVNIALKKRFSLQKTAQIANKLAFTLRQEMVDRTFEGKDRKYGKLKQSTNKEYRKLKRTIITGRTPTGKPSKNKLVKQYRKGRRDTRAGKVTDSGRLMGVYLSSFDAKVTSIQRPTAERAGFIKVRLFINEARGKFGRNLKKQHEGLEDKGYEIFGYGRFSNDIKQEIRDILNG